MVQAANNEVTFDVRIPIDKAVADLKAGETRIVAGVEQMAARASKSAQIHFKPVFDEASVKKRMAEMIRDMERQATNARIEMEARVRLFGPDGQTPLDQWMKRSMEFAGKSTWSSGEGKQQVNSMSQAEQWHRMSVAAGNRPTWSSGADPMAGGGASGAGGGPSISGDASGGGIGDMFGKRSAIGQATSLLRGGGAIVGLTIMLDQLGRAVGSMRQLRDEIRLGDKSAGDMAQSFGRSIPVLGKIVTIGAELRELIGGENFNLARQLEADVAIGSATQQIFQLQRDVNKIVAEAERQNENIQREIDVAKMPEGGAKAEAQFQTKLDAKDSDANAKIAAAAAEIRQKYKDLIEKPMSGTIDPNLKISANALAQMRSDKSLQELREEAQKGVSEAMGALPYKLAIPDENNNERIVKTSESVIDSLSEKQLAKMSEGYASVQKLVEAKSKLAVLDKSIADINEAAEGDKGKGTTGTVGAVTDKLKETQALAQTLEETQRAALNTFNANTMERFDIPAAQARGGGKLFEAERLELQKQLYMKQLEADSLGEESGKAQKQLGDEILSQYDRRVMLARAESQIMEGARIKAAQQRLNRDFTGADRTERDARNQVELMQAQQSGGRFGMLKAFAIQQLEGGADAAEKRMAKEMSVDRSVANLRQSQLRASQRFYDAEVEAIEFAYDERERMAKTDEERTVAINERAARMTELNASVEQRAKDAGFEANQIRLRREGKDVEAQRNAIMRQADDELKQVGDNANARDAIFARTKEQLLELQDMDGRRMGSGSWLADSIYSLDIGGGGKSGKLNATNQAALASLGSPSGGGLFSAITGVAKNLVAVMGSEMNSVATTGGGTTDADAKVELRGESVTLLRKIVENTANNTATFSA